MHDSAYKKLFGRPGMVRDLLDGFAARGWSGALDFDGLTALPASFVRKEFQQRHGDLVWNVRFRAYAELRKGARKVDAGAAEGLAAALAGVTDPDRLGRVGDWIIECGTASDLLARVRADNGSGG